MNIYTVDLVKAYINSHHGWAVAEQFEDTFNGESFDEQNENALDYIRDAVNSLIDSELLADDVIDELQEYYDKLEKHLFPHHQ